MDLSLISPSDETSLMQLPASRPARNDLQAMCKLIESIEAVHAQLAKTLLESQRIIRSEAVPNDETSCDAEIQATTSTPRSKSVDDTAHIQKSVVEGKAKPKITSNETVNIQLNRFKTQKKPQATSVIKTPERNSWPPRTVPLHEEEVIEKLSKEILRQSNNLDKAGSAFISLKRNDESSVQYNASPSKGASLINNILETHEKDNGITKENIPAQEVNCIFIFVDK